jgi:hypothetical protein
LKVAKPDLRGYGYEDLTIRRPLMAKEVPHCCVCGKPCAEGDDTSRMSDGKIVNGKHKDKTEFGVFHRSCRNRAVMIPSAVRDELQRQARANSR